jgi:DNA adenine methylase
MIRRKGISVNLKPPIVYYGGKIRLAPWIVSVMRRYTFERYLEVFGGSAAVMFAMEPSKCEIYNDCFGDMVNLYKVLRDPQQYKELLRSIESSPYSRQIYNDARRGLDDMKISEVERARCFFVSLRQSFSNLMNSWSTPSECSRTVAADTYWKAIDRLPEVHERLKHVHIEHMDAIECIKKYANERSLIYVDPPYVSGTRVAPQTYKHEFSDGQHRQLVETLLAVPGHKILSGYESPIYKPLLDAGWELLTREVCCHASGNSKKTYRIECLYCSPIKCNVAINDNTGIIRLKSKGENNMKHPYDRRVFFTGQSDRFISLNDIQRLALTGKLSAFDVVFDVNGDSYRANDVVMGKAPQWALFAEHDPMLQGLPTPSAEDMAMANELLCEPDFLEMPREPKAKTVKDYLSREPRIARMVASAERCMFR